MAQFSVKIMRLTGSVLGENQHADDLVFGEPATLHLWSFRLGQSLSQTGLGGGGNVTAEIRKWHVGGIRLSQSKWHLDEVFVGIDGERHSLWRTVDHEGEVLESFVT